MVNLLLVGLPRLAVRGIGQLVTEGLALEVVLGDGVAQVHTARIDTLDDEVGLADSVGLGVDFGSRQLELYKASRNR